MKNIFILIFTLSFFSSLAYGEDPAFNASLVPDVAIYKRTQTIRGFTLSIWGENPTRGVSIGLVNGTIGDSAGFSWGVVNYADRYTGFQLGFFNWAKVSYSGLQAGVVNFSERLRGLQFGLVNFARAVDETGVQVGFINILSENKDFFTDFPRAIGPAMVIVNWRFKTL